MPTDGIHQLSREEYDAVEAVNISSLVNMSVSPLYYRWRKSHDIDTEALRFGRAVDLAVFEPLIFERNYIVWEGLDHAGKKVIKKGAFWEDFKALADNDGKTIIDADDHALALEIRKSIRNDPLAKQYLHQGHEQLTLIWTDKETGFRCKGRIDWLTLRKALCDLKTGRSVLPRKFSRDGAELHYHVKMAWYADALELLDCKPSEVVLIVVEKVGPLDVVCFDLDDDALSVGRFEYHRWMQQLADCVTSNTWPGIGRGKKCPFNIPRYLRTDFDNLESTALSKFAEGLEALT
jgi:hypothetical protein